jgi:hypothetical protein
VGLNQGIREGYFLASALLTMSLLTCGMFAFLMLAGSYLGVVRSGTPLAGVPRRLTDATVIACMAALLALAFRNALWWIIGTNANSAGNGQFADLLGIDRHRVRGRFRYRVDYAYSRPAARTNPTFTGPSENR